MHIPKLRLALCLATVLLPLTLLSACGGSSSDSTASAVMGAATVASCGAATNTQVKMRCPPGFTPPPAAPASSTPSP